jgi:hypothetical protein
MVKVKRLRSADCVVGGFRYLSNSPQVGSLLLGLYNNAGKLDHVASRRPLPRTTGLNSPASSRRCVSHPALPERRQAARAAGTPNAAANGSRFGPNWWWKCGSIMSPAIVSGMAPSSCAGGRTRLRNSARSSRSLRGFTARRKLLGVAEMRLKQMDRAGCSVQFERSGATEVALLSVGLEHHLSAGLPARRGLLRLCAARRL